MRLDPSRVGGWADLPFFSQDLPGIARALAAETRPVLPPEAQVFAALEATPPDAVRAVILGQDPYPTPGHAHGFAFSVTPKTRPLPRSLVNIYKELKYDLDVHRTHGDLRGWARQGVLLLNAALTVPAGAAGGHLKLGWRQLAEQVLRRLSDRPRALILWGKPAQALGAAAHGDHLRVESPHPSPLSAHRGFFGSRPFSRVNAWLIASGEAPIDWAAP
ncbi:MAG: uracil-DNA glycosylase [Pseudomonadota bacterium]